MLTRLNHHALGFAVGIAAAMFWFGLAQADAPILSQASEIGTASVAPPAEYSFTTTTAQALTVTLNDLQTPAAFTSLQIAVTLGNALVGTATIASGASTATVAVPGAIGQYTVHVIGTPNVTSGVGTFGVCVAPATQASACIDADSYSGTIQAPSGGASVGTSPFSTTFTTTGDAGNYTVTITDDQFPAALSSTTPLSGGITLGGTQVFGPLATGVNTVPGLAANTTYDLLLVAVAAAPTNAGLYSVQIADPQGNVVFAQTVPVGTLSAATPIPNASAQSLTLTLNDLADPVALTSVDAAVTSGASAPLAILTASGSVGFSAPAGTLELWQYALAGVQPGIYSVSLAAGASSVYATTRVAPSTSGAAATSFAFVVNLESAGSYSVAVTDLQFPLSLQTLTYTIAQNGAAITPTSSGVFTAAAGPVEVVVNAVPATSSTGLFALTITASGATAPAFDQLQTVGGALNTTVVNFGADGTYNITLTDLAFPSAFQNLAVIVSSSGQSLGKIYQQGTFAFPATAGAYQLTFVATPGASNYGLYSVLVAPALPTVSLSASPTTVTTGEPTQLTWTSQNATACTASGATGWTGSEALSGTTAVTITANVTLTLTCTGPGGTSTPQSVSIAATAVTSSSHGGGALDLASLALLSIIWLMTLWRSRRKSM